MISAWKSQIAESALWIWEEVLKPQLGPWLVLGAFVAAVCGPVIGLALLSGSADLSLALFGTVAAIVGFQSGSILTRLINWHRLSAALRAPTKPLLIISVTYTAVWILLSFSNDAAIQFFVSRSIIAGEILKPVHPFLGIIDCVAIITLMVLSYEHSEGILLPVYRRYKRSKKWFESTTLVIFTLSTVVLSGPGAIIGTCQPRVDDLQIAKAQHQAQGMVELYIAPGAAPVGKKQSHAIVARAIETMIDVKVLHFTSRDQLKAAIAGNGIETDTLSPYIEKQVSKDLDAASRANLAKVDAHAKYLVQTTPLQDYTKELIGNVVGHLLGHTVHFNETIAGKAGEEIFGDLRAEQTKDVVDAVSAAALADLARGRVQNGHLDQSDFDRVFSLNSSRQVAAASAGALNRDIKIDEGAVAEVGALRSILKWNGRRFVPVRVKFVTRRSVSFWKWLVKALK